jgi:hypothetical protein
MVDDDDLRAAAVRVLKSAQSSEPAVHMGIEAIERCWRARTLPARLFVEVEIAQGLRPISTSVVLDLADGPVQRILWHRPAE